MQKNQLIEDHFKSANYITLCQMYLNNYVASNDIKESDLKGYNPGHLGTSLSLNFILANLNYFLNSNNLSSRLIIGTGHSGVSLLANQWLNGTLSKYYPKYSNDKEGLNNLISDFGSVIRSEINPQYPESIYDGGELGYSLGVAYGYALNANEDVVPCIIGDGEAETGTLSSAWQLNKLLETKSKVLPIINLNGLKMGSESYLSRFSNNELIKYYSLLGYDVSIVDGTKENDITTTIEEMQNCLANVLQKKHPLLIFRSKKGYTLPNVNGIAFEGESLVHKNPLQGMEINEKMDVVKSFLQQYETSIFDQNGRVNSKFLNFQTSLAKQNDLIVNKVPIDNKLKGIKNLESYLLSFIKNNDFKIFSPDEIVSNQLGSLNSNCFELLNENLLQAMYQGYIASGKNGLYVSYESFMPIITSMMAQYYKFLKQKQSLENSKDTFSMNYLLTSTCWENTYSHQNPEFVNTLLQRDDAFYSVYYPKDGKELVKCMEKSLSSKNQINVIVTAKRHTKDYSEFEDNNLEIQTLVDCKNPQIILCATGDYMLDILLQVYERLKINNDNIKVIYVTNPKILDKNSTKGLKDEEFYNYFPKEIPITYLYAGYPSIIKSMLFDRNVKCDILGYNDQITVCGNVVNNTNSNGISPSYVEDICNSKLTNDTQVLRRKL